MGRGIVYVVSRTLIGGNGNENNDIVALSGDRDEVIKTIAKDLREHAHYIADSLSVRGKTILYANTLSSALNDLFWEVLKGDSHKTIERNAAFILLIQQGNAEETVWLYHRSTSSFEVLPCAMWKISAFDDPMGY